MSVAVASSNSQSGNLFLAFPTAYSLRSTPQTCARGLKSRRSPPAEQPTSRAFSARRETARSRMNLQNSSLFGGSPPVGMPAPEIRIKHDTYTARCLHRQGIALASKVQSCGPSDLLPTMISRMHSPCRPFLQNQQIPESLPGLRQSAVALSAIQVEILH